MVQPKPRTTVCCPQLVCFYAGKWGSSMALAGSFVTRETVLLQGGWAIQGIDPQTMLPPRSLPFSPTGALPPTLVIAWIPKAADFVLPSI